MVNTVGLYCLYILLYIPLALYYIIILINFCIYHLILYSIDTYYYFSQSQARLNGLPYTKVVNYSEKFFYWLETPRNLSYNNMILKFDSRIDSDAWKETLKSKMLSGLDEKGEAIFPTFRQVLRDGNLFSTWEYEGEVNIEEQTSDVEIDLTDEDTVEKFFSDLENIKLPNNKPKWHYYFIVDPNREDISYVVMRIHHSLCDGLSTWKVILKICDVDNKEELGASKLAAIQIPSFQKAMAKIQTFIVLPILTIKHLIFIREYNLKYTNEVTGVKKVAWTNKLDFEKIRTVKRKTNTTVNDVLLTLVTESLKRYFTRYPCGDILKKEIILGSAIALEGNMDNYTLTNSVVGIPVKIPVNIEGKFEQLEIIRRNMRRLKYGTWLWFFSFSLNWVLTAPIPTQKLKEILNILPLLGIYSNVPGPTSQLYCSGASIEEIYGTVMTSWNQSLGIVFVTYRGKMDICVKVDTVLMENPNEFLKEVPEVLEEMYSEVQGLI